MYSISVFDKGYDFVVVVCQVMAGTVFAAMAPAVAPAGFLLASEKRCDQRFQLFERNWLAEIMLSPVRPENGLEPRFIIGRKDDHRQGGCASHDPGRDRSFVGTVVGIEHDQGDTSEGFLEV